MLNFPYYFSVTFEFFSSFILWESVLDLMDQMGNSMEFQGESTNIKTPVFALSMINVDPDEFSGLTFGVSLSSTMNPEVSWYDCNKTVTQYTSIIYSYGKN